jgi:hypothetical protein
MPYARKFLQQCLMKERLRPNEVIWMAQNGGRVVQIYDANAIMGHLGPEMA